MKKLSFDVIVSENHGLKPKGRVAFTTYLQSLTPGTELTLTLEPPKEPTRTNNANRYYWSAVIPPLAEYFGYTALELHEELKVMFNPKTSKIDPMRTVGGTTTTLTKSEFQEYMTQIKIWAVREYAIILEDE